MSDEAHQGVVRTNLVDQQRRSAPISVITFNTWPVDIAVQEMGARLFGKRNGLYGNLRYDLAINRPR